MALAGATRVQRNRLWPLQVRFGEGKMALEMPIRNIENLKLAKNNLAPTSRRLQNAIEWCEKACLLQERRIGWGNLTAWILCVAFMVMVSTCTPLSWEEATRINTPSAYETYLADHSGYDFNRKDAEARIPAKREYDRTMASGSAQAMAAFILENYSVKEETWPDNQKRHLKYYIHDYTFDLVVKVAERLRKVDPRQCVGDDNTAIGEFMGVVREIACRQMWMSRPDLSSIQFHNMKWGYYPMTLDGRYWGRYADPRAQNFQHVKQGKDGMYWGTLANFQLANSVRTGKLMAFADVDNWDGCTSSIDCADQITVSKNPSGFATLTDLVVTVEDDGSGRAAACIVKRFSAASDGSILARRDTRLGSRSFFLWNGCWQGPWSP